MHSLLSVPGRTVKGAPASKEISIMKVFIITLALLAMVVSGDYHKPPKDDDCCDKKCRNKPENHNCKDLKYQGISACAYYCICDGEYKYYYEDNFSECGKNRYCYWGDCLPVAEDCPCDCYGDCFIGLKHPYNPCQCNCYNKTGCTVYHEYLPCGTCCFNEQCCAAGTCKCGDCVPNY